MDTADSGDIESCVVHTGSDIRSNNSIPSLIRPWYGHNTFRNMILGVLSMTCVVNAFVCLHVGILSSCEAIGMITGIVLLYSPSPLHYKK